jgi:hypothetical protein
VTGVNFGLLEGDDGCAAPPTSPTYHTCNLSMCGATSLSKNSCRPDWTGPANTSGHFTARAAAITDAALVRVKPIPQHVSLLASLQRPVPHIDGVADDAHPSDVVVA